MTTQTLTLSNFLLARIAERESTAQDMRHQARLGRPFINPQELAGGAGIRELIDPDRVLAECEAKRRIVEDNPYPDAEFPDYDGGYQSAWEDYRKILALPYANHPDYRPEWRP